MLVMIFHRFLILNCDEKIAYTAKKGWGTHVETKCKLSWVFPV